MHVCSNVSARLFSALPWHVGPTRPRSSSIGFYAQFGFRQICCEGSSARSSATWVLRFAGTWFELLGVNCERLKAASNAAYRWLMLACGLSTGQDAWVKLQLHRQC